MSNTSQYGSIGLKTRAIAIGNAIVCRDNSRPLMVAIDLSCHQNNNEVEKRKVKMKLEL